MTILNDFVGKTIATITRIDDDKKVLFEFTDRKLLTIEHEEWDGLANPCFIFSFDELRGED